MLLFRQALCMSLICMSASIGASLDAFIELLHLFKVITDSWLVSLSELVKVCSLSCSLSHHVQVIEWEDVELVLRDEHACCKLIWILLRAIRTELLLSVLLILA